MGCSGDIRSMFQGRLGFQGGFRVEWTPHRQLLHQSGVFQHLYNRGINACGTVRSNCRHFPLFYDIPMFGYKWSMYSSLQSILPSLCCTYVHSEGQLLGPARVLKRLRPKLIKSFILGQNVTISGKPLIIFQRSLFLQTNLLNLKLSQ